MTGDLAFFVPGDIEQRSGGYGYARAMMAEWAGMGIDCEHVELPGDFPFPSELSLMKSAALLEAMPPERPVLIDGLAFGALSPDVIRKCKAPLTVLLHHPLGLESGLAERTAKSMLETERTALRHAGQVIVTSTHTQKTVERLFDVPASSIKVAFPGTPRRKRARRLGDPPVILAVGSLTPRKGHRDLVAALAEIEDIDWRSRFIGSNTADPGTADAIAADIERLGLQERITLEGARSEGEMEAAYGEADLFALASHYEGYGMAFAEALSAGLPVVGYRAGAVPDVVPDAAGLLVETGNQAELAAALGHLLSNRKAAHAMADAAWQAGQALPDWRATAEVVWQSVRLTEAA